MTTAMIPSTLISNHAPSFETPALLDVLIVDDERPTREACRDAAAALGCRTTVADSVDQAVRLVGSQNIDVVLLALNLPDAVRLQVVRQITQKRNGVEVAIVTLNPAAEPAIEAMRAGAFDCLIKPFGLEELRRMLESIASKHKAKIASRQFAEQIKSSGFGGMIGRAPQMEKVYRIISKAAQITHPVLILGESGTGKELVARAIHYSGPFRDKPFTPIDCGSLVPTLIESELFGYAKGAFTGAAQSKQGLLAVAEGGTVFLDEIGELALDLQAKLLRALQEKEIRPVGSTKAMPINVRILAATNRDLEQEVGNGRFRRDLYFRLNVLNVRLPALRERRDDIPLLAAHLLERISRRSGRSYSLSADVMQSLVAYDWPGNVRELENSIERCCAMNSGPIIHAADLPSHLTAAEQEYLGAPTAQITPLADLEREAILAAITQLNGDKLMAARLLGIGKTTLYRKLKQYEVLQ